jgi:hypothetical protein
LPTIFILVATASPALAQNPYYPYGYAPLSGFGPGATLAGQAQVIQAQGQLMINEEQARQERQKYYQDKLTTKKMAFDEAAYEKANTPSFTEDQEKVMNLQVRRMLNQANPTEIKRGDTLNTLMPYIKAMSDQGIPGPPLPVNPSLLRQINVEGGSGLGAGMLKDGGKLSWPLMLRGETQKKIDKVLVKACSDAAAGTLEAKTYNEIANSVKKLQKENDLKYQKEQINGQSYLSCQAYLDSLAASLKVLQRPDAAKFFDGSYTVHGSNVPEVVDNMLAEGLKFGPATTGSESAYFAMHNAFVSYTRSAQSGTGFQSRLAPPPQAKKGF